MFPFNSTLLVFSIIYLYSCAKEPKNLRDVAKLCNCAEPAAKEDKDETVSAVPVVAKKELSLPSSYCCGK